MFDQMKKLMEMKRQADQLKKELDAMTVECEDIHGIKIVMNGSMDVKSIEINEQLLSSGNKNRLENDLLRSFNAAIKKAQMKAAENMKGMFPGLGGQMKPQLSERSETKLFG